MNDHPIQGLMTTVMQSIKEMVDVNTIIGDPITTIDGVTIIPVSKVGFGFTSGGSDFSVKSAQGQKLFGGGGGAGISIHPIAFLVVVDGEVKLLQINENAGTVDRIVTLVPELVDKVKSMFGKDKSKRSHAAADSAEASEY